MIDRFFWLLFSLRGRIGRGTFAVAWIIQIAVWGIYQIPLWRRYLVVTFDAEHKPHLALDAPPAVWAILFFLATVAVWVALAVQIKRLHDFNMSGWWLAGPIGGVLVGAMLNSLFAALHLPSGFVLGDLFLVAAAFAGLMLVTMMLLRPGDWGDNGHPRGPEEDATARGDHPTARSHAGLGRPGAAHTFGRRGASR